MNENNSSDNQDSLYSTQSQNITLYLSDDEDTDLNNVINISSTDNTFIKSDDSIETTLNGTQHGDSTFGGESTTKRFFVHKKIIKPEESSSSSIKTNGKKQNVVDDIQTITSTPANSCDQQIEDLKSISDLTPEFIPKPSKPGVLRLFVECVYLAKTTDNQSCKELINILCEPNLEINRFGCNSSAYYADASADSSRKSSPLSSGSGNLVPFPLPSASNRISHMSMASSLTSSSLGSSAGALNSKLMMKAATQAARLTEERINELKARWLGTDLLYKILDIIDTLDDDYDSSQVNPLPKNGIVDVVLPGDVPNNTKYLKREGDAEIFKESTAGKRNRSSPSFKPDLEVFAKWKNRKYYSAKLIEKTKDDKWLVMFYDGQEKHLSEDQLLLIDNYSLLIGQRVYASETGEIYQKGLINRVDYCGDIAMYLVLTDNGDFSVPSKNIYITESQAKSIKKSLNLNFDDSIQTVSSSYSDSPCYRRSYFYNDNPIPCTSGLQKDLLKGKQKTSESDDDLSDSNSSADGPILSVIGCEKEMSSMISLINRHHESMKSNKLPISHQVGPLPIGKWFKNLYFLLSSSGRINKKSRSIAFNSGSESMESGAEDYDFSCVPFIQDRLKLQLENGSGKVYKNFELIPSQVYKNTYLISDRPNTTTRYQQCLAVGIKVLSHEWVIRCCKEKRLLPIQELPSGWSLEHNRFINSFERESTQPLRGQKIYIAQLSDKNFYKFWARLCKLAGATVEKFTDQITLDNVFCIVVEGIVQDTALDKATSKGIPLVSTVWVTQTIIHGEIRPFDGHPKYNYLYDDSCEY